MNFTRKKTDSAGENDIQSSLLEQHVSPSKISARDKFRNNFSSPTSIDNTAFPLSDITPQFSSSGLIRRETITGIIIIIILLITKFLININ
jgi:hypothetical protein